MKVAFATNDGINIDEHFGRARSFSIFEIVKDSYVFIERRLLDDEISAGLPESREEAVHFDRIEQKIERLSDCRIVYFTEIGGPAAARVINRGIMPVKITGLKPVLETMEQLMETIKKSPPPWIRKALSESLMHDMHEI